MICPKCKAWVRVLQTRAKKDGEVRRRYECGNHHRFSTMEYVLVETLDDFKDRVSQPDNSATV